MSAVLGALILALGGFHLCLRVLICEMGGECFPAYLGGCAVPSGDKNWLGKVWVFPTAFFVSVRNVQVFIVNLPPSPSPPPNIQLKISSQPLQKNFS